MTRLTTHVSAVALTVIDLRALLAHEVVRIEPAWQKGEADAEARLPARLAGTTR